MKVFVVGVFGSELIFSTRIGFGINCEVVSGRTGAGGWREPFPSFYKKNPKGFLKKIKFLLIFQPGY